MCKVQRLLGSKRPLSVPPEVLVANYEGIFAEAGIMADDVHNVQNAVQMQSGDPAQMQQQQFNAMQQQQQQQMMYGGAGMDPNQIQMNQAGVSIYWYIVYLDRSSFCSLFNLWYIWGWFSCFFVIQFNFYLRAVSQFLHNLIKSVSETNAASFFFCIW